MALASFAASRRHHALAADGEFSDVCAKWLYRYRGYFHPGMAFLMQLEKGNFLFRRKRAASTPGAEHYLVARPGRLALPLPSILAS